MGEIADRPRVLQHPIEIRLLDDHRRRGRSDGRFELGGIDAAIWPVGNPQDLVVLCLRVSLQHLGIFRVQRAGDHHILAGRVGDRHRGGLGQRRRAVIE